VRLQATCLAVHADAPIDRAELARALLRRLDAWVARITAGGLEALHAAWIARCGMLHEWVRVRCGQEVHEGTVVDVSPMEGLLLATDAGRLVHLPAELSTLLP
jgi:biotin-(acetyl-CoA carboxylase) ligase